jgi:hypothetical protein
LHHVSSTTCDYALTIRHANATEKNSFKRNHGADQKEIPVMNVTFPHEVYYKGSFASYYLGLESKKIFMILTIICLATTELVMEFI